MTVIDNQLAEIERNADELIELVVSISRQGETLRQTVTEMLEETVTELRADR